MQERRIVKPQEGFQQAFLSSPADIVIGGGAAGAGKSFALLLDPLRYAHIRGFGAVIFRRTTTQIKNEGGLWDTASNLYPLLGADSREYLLQWEFPQARIRFAHLEYEKNKLDHQGGQYPYIGFDELTSFTKTQFLYLLSRNRSPIAGIRPCIRATCNPDPDSWLAEFLEWWIDQQTGFPIPERAGVLRYFVNDGGNFVWGDTVEEVIERCPHIFNNPELQGIEQKDLVKSITFIPGSIYQNKLLLKNNPDYLANLLALPEEEQLRLLQGNWKIRQDGSALFDFKRINDLFSNFIDEGKDKYITVDYARFGQDLTVILTWVGFRVVRIEVMTKSSTVEAYEAIEKERERMKIPRSQVLVDDDGVGGGVTDQSKGEYVPFHAGATPHENEHTDIRENFINLKTQCYYALARRVNAAEVRVYTDNIIVDGYESEDVKVRGKIYNVVKMIKEDLRAIKMKKMDDDGKKRINSKEEQKNILGRSPDFGDALSTRMFFELGNATIESSDVAFV